MLVYRCFIGEAMIKVITGIFLWETFKSATADDEVMIMQKERQMRKHVQKMDMLFKEADTQGDGILNLEEFSEIVNDPRVNTWLKSMDIDVNDAKIVFGLIDDGDGKLSAQEVVQGFGRLKGPARSLDMAQLMKDVRRIKNSQSRLYDKVTNMTNWS